MSSWSSGPDICLPLEITSLLAKSIEPAGDKDCLIEAPNGRELSRVRRGLEHIESVSCLLELYVPAVVVRSDTWPGLQIETHCDNEL